MSISFKPIFAISWLSIGKIFFKPSFAVSILPPPDLPQSFAASTRRVVSYSQSFIGFSYRVISAFQSFTACSLRCVDNSLAPVSYTARSLRIISNRQSFATNTNRLVFLPFKAISLRKVSNFQSFSASSNRCLVQKFAAISCRSISKSQSFAANSIIRIPFKINFYKNHSLLRTVKDDSPTAAFFSSLELFHIISFNLNLNELTLSDTLSFDSYFHFDINSALSGQLFDYCFNFLVEETSDTGVNSVQSVKAMYNKDELLFSQFYLSNNVISAFLSNDDKLNLIPDNVKTLLSHATNFSFAGKDISRQSFIDLFVSYNLPVSSIIKYIASALGLNANIKMQDFKHKDFVNNLGNYVTYQSMLSQLFNWSSQIPNYQINCFIRGDTLNVIMRGFEDSVFDISDLNFSTPTFQRKLIRNLWNDVIDSDDFDDNDDEYNHYFSGTINHDIDNMFCSYTFENGLLTKEFHRLYSMEMESDIVNHYEATQYITYKYKSLASFWDNFNFNDVTLSFEPPDKLKLDGSDNINNFYLISKEEKSTDQQWSSSSNLLGSTKTVHTNSTNYEYKTISGEGIYLFSENTQSKVQEFSYKSNSLTAGGMSLDSEEIDNDIVLHAPLGNSFYSSASYHNGKPTGSSISQGKPSQTVSRYTVSQIQSSFFKSDDDVKDSILQNMSERSRLKAIVNTSFPIVEDDIKEACIDAMFWLNRKIQEDVFVDLLSPVVDGFPTLDHIIDFTERIKLFDNEYFLVSNNIILSVNRFIQRLHLVRWF